MARNDVRLKDVAERLDAIEEQVHVVVERPIQNEQDVLLALSQHPTP